MKKWLVITGPTASGKTRLAVHAAHRIGGEVISIDSRQVYRGMNIGTGKDLDEYIIGDRRIPVHLVDIREPGEDYHVAAFQKDFEEAILDLEKRDITPVLCGGSGLYLEAVLEGHHFTKVPVNESFRKSCDGQSINMLRKKLKEGSPLPYPVDLKSKKRIIRALEIQRYLEENPLANKAAKKDNAEVFILGLPREIRRERISTRLKERFSRGMLEEVQKLRTEISDDQLIRYGLEYKWITYYLKGDLTYEEMYNKLETEIHRFSKRQMTWFRRLERKRSDVHWIDATLPVETQLNQLLNYY